MRNAFIEELTAAAKEFDNIVLVVGDLGFGVVEPFATRFPDRFFNAGVAEQNMMGLAAGLASEGFHVFVYSIANFPTFRCAEQIRNDVDYHQLPVTIVAVGGGLAYGNLGYSHHAVQDYALMRIMPNMLIAAPGDPMETRACLRYLVTNPQPSYLRLGKAGEPNIHTTIPEVKPGQWLAVRSSQYERRACLTTGATLYFAHRAITAHHELVETSLYSMPLWSMRTKAAQAKQIARFEQVITLEDHLQDGGFGSWMLEANVSHADLRTIINPIGLDTRVCGMVGKQNTLNAAGGITEDALLKALCT